MQLAQYPFLVNTEYSVKDYYQTQDEGSLMIRIRDPPPIAESMLSFISIQVNNFLFKLRSNIYCLVDLTALS